MIIVSDTSPLNYLILVGVEDVLPRLFGTVFAPPAVLQEMQHCKAAEKVRRWAASPPAWLEIRAPQTTVPFSHLGPGEVEAIALALEIQTDKVLIDDRSALAIAADLGLSCFGTLAVLDLAGEQGLVDLPAVIDELGKTSFHASRALIKRLIERDEERRRPPEI